MTRSVTIILLTVNLTIIPFMPGCGSKSNSGQAAGILTTSSYLESAVREIAGSGTATLSLAGAGMCPGHFDLRPGQIEQFRRCRVFFRFDFQATMDTKIQPLATQGLKVIPINVEGGLSEPSSYVSACRQVGEGLVSARVIDSRTAILKLAGTENRMKEISLWAREEIKRAGLIGRPVLTSRHQADFCRWLGLKVVSPFSSSDTIGVQTIDVLIAAGRAAGVKLIVANAPEGRQLADALAEALGAEVKVAVLDNFPREIKGQNAFDAMFHGNIRELVRESH